MSFLLRVCLLIHSQRNDQARSLSLTTLNRSFDSDPLFVILERSNLGLRTLLKERPWGK